MHPNDLLTIDRNREDAYRLLAACFYPPDLALAEENVCTALAEVLSPLSPQAAVAAIAMGESLAVSLPEELAVEHARLFVGPFQLVAPPYGSLYLDVEKKLMGDSTVEVQRLYQEQGLHLAGDFTELPDQVTVELEFMSFLANRSREAATQVEKGVYRELLVSQKDFLERHLGKWCPEFCRLIAEGTDNSFYRALAECTASFVAADLASLAGCVAGIDKGGRHASP